MFIHKLGDTNVKMNLIILKQHLPFVCIARWYLAGPLWHPVLQSNLHFSVILQAKIMQNSNTNTPFYILPDNSIQNTDSTSFSHSIFILITARYTLHP